VHAARVRDVPGALNHFERVVGRVDQQFSEQVLRGEPPVVKLGRGDLDQRRVLIFGDDRPFRSGGEAVDVSGEPDAVRSCARSGMMLISCLRVCAASADEGRTRF
jgi:hypothetical protein